MLVTHLWPYKTGPGLEKKEAPAGFEPAMADLQSAALATWPRRLSSFFQAFSDFSLIARQCFDT